MSLLDKMNRNNTPDDNGGNGKSHINFDDIKPDKPKRRPPALRMLASREGRRQMSLAALMERITDQFHAENSPDDSAVRAATTRVDRMKLLLPVVEYTMGVESIMAEDDEKAEIMRAAYSAIFGFGPLDPFIEDEEITTVTIEGIEKVSVRRGHGDMEAVDMIFQDESQLKEITGRLLKRSGAALRADLPIVEAGFLADNGRFISVTMAAPPVTLALNMDIRLHPTQAPTLDALVERGTLPEKGAQLLRALMQSEYGLTLVGQPESGKTMTLSALLAELPNPQATVAVERTGELHLPQGINRAVVEWAQRPGDEGVTFGGQIEAQLERDYAVMVLDEVRADEPHSIAPLLNADNPPRLIWSFRGVPDSKRLVSALGMLARRASVEDGENLVRSLFTQLPYVVSVRRLAGRIELREVGEWYYADGSDGVRYRPLMQTANGETFTTGEIPDHPLPGLDALFWSASE